MLTAFGTAIGPLTVVGRVLAATSSAATQRHCWPWRGRRASAKARRGDTPQDEADETGTPGLERGRTAAPPARHTQAPKSAQVTASRHNSDPWGIPPTRLATLVADLPQALGGQAHPVGVSSEIGTCRFDPACAVFPSPIAEVSLRGGGVL
jgi:hypothetical protein